jgi:predicted small integral membrane protein
LQFGLGARRLYDRAQFSVSLDTAFPNAIAEFATNVPLTFGRKWGIVTLRRSTSKFVTTQVVGMAHARSRDLAKFDGSVSGSARRTTAAFATSLDCGTWKTSPSARMVS